MTIQNKSSGTPVFNKRYDLAGNSIMRTFRHQLLARVIPLGNYRGGAGMRCLVSFAVLHYFGGAIFQILIRFEKQTAVLYRIRERFRKS